MVSTASMVRPPSSEICSDLWSCVAFTAVSKPSTELADAIVTFELGRTSTGAVEPIKLPRPRPRRLFGGLIFGVVLCASMRFILLSVVRSAIFGGIRCLPEMGPLDVPRGTYPKLIQRCSTWNIVQKLKRLHKTIGPHRQVSPNMFHVEHLLESTPDARINRNRLSVEFG